MTTWQRIAPILLLAAATASAADDWTLTTSDFNTRPVTPHGLDGDTLVVATEGVEAKVPLGTLVSLSRGSRAKPPAGLVLCLDDGQRLIGGPSRMDGSNLVWNATGIGPITVPLESAVAILRDRSTPDAATGTTEDVAKLNSGDAVRGILSDASADGFSFTPAAGGEATKVSPKAVAGIEFAVPPGGRKPSKTPAFLVRTAGGSVVAASAVRLTKDKLTLTAVREVALPLTDVVAIEHTGGPVAWLSARRPTESVHTPYLGGSLPARFNTDVLRNPIRAGGVTYTHGIGVHSRSKLVFAVLPGDKTFRTRYAIDGSLSRADVDVRVLVDGKIVHEQKGFKAGPLSPIVTADVSGAKTLTLEVDYGNGYDVQDRLNWIEPAMIQTGK